MSAVAVKDGRVLSTGTVESMHPPLSRYDSSVDDSLSDKVILPGARLATLEREGVTFALHSDYPQVVLIDRAGSIDRAGLEEDLVACRRSATAATEVGEQRAAAGSGD